MAKPAPSKIKEVPSQTESQPDVVEAGVAIPDYEQTARLAYSYWEARGYQGGSPEEDWLRAEQELTRNQAQTTNGRAAGSKSVPIR